MAVEEGLSSLWLHCMAGSIAAENKKPEDANSAAGIILVGRPFRAAGVGVPFVPIDLSMGFNVFYVNENIVQEVYS